MAKLRINTRDGLAQDVEIHAVEDAVLSGSPDLEFTIRVQPGKRLRMHWEETDLPVAEAVFTSDIERPIDIQMTHFDVDVQEPTESS